MDTRRVRTLTEFVDCVTRLQGHGIRLWFRGVSSTKQRLVPGIIWRGEAEWEQSYVHYFLVGYKAYISQVPSNPWDLYCLMQHHGLPTRLLDWSRSALNALFFALTQAPEARTTRAVYLLLPADLNESTLGDPGVVCPGALGSRKLRVPSSQAFDLDAYLPQALDPNDNYALPERPIAIEAPVFHPRVQGQMGCFTVHGSSQKPIETFLPKRRYPRSIARFTIAPSDRLPMLKSLYSLGVTEDVIYQDLDSLCTRITREQLELCRLP